MAIPSGPICNTRWKLKRNSNHSRIYHEIIQSRTNSGNPTNAPTEIRLLRSLHRVTDITDPEIHQNQLSDRRKLYNRRITRKLTIPIQSNGLFQTDELFGRNAK